VYNQGYYYQAVASGLLLTFVVALAIDSIF
jgi:hypothetical protein